MNNITIERINISHDVSVVKLYESEYDVLLRVNVNVHNVGDYSFKCNKITVNIYSLIPTIFTVDKRYKSYRNSIIATKEYNGFFVVESGCKDSMPIEFILKNDEHYLIQSEIVNEKRSILEKQPIVWKYETIKTVCIV